MNKYLKAFLNRGLMFGGCGPVIVGIIYAVLASVHSNFSLTGTQVCLAIISVYLLAFLQAGASVFNQIEEWPLAKSLFFHFATLYVAYVSCYLLNTWIPFKAEIVMIFTAIFIAVYFVIWVTVYLCVKATSKRFNKKLN